MNINRKDVEHVAKLAKLELTEEEKEKFTQQLDAIMSYMEKLNEVNTEDIEPTAYVQELKNVFREDEVEKSLSVEEVLKNAAETEDDYFKVPRTIEE